MHAERCLNRRHRSEFCHICCDICPQNAIDISGLTVRINTTKCDLCALCIADCPTEVFTHKDFSPLDFLAQARERQTLDLRCKFTDNIEPDMGDMRIPCHGLLDDRLLTGLHAMGVEHLHLRGINQCESCPSRVGSNRLSKTLEKTSPELQKHFPIIHSDCDDASNLSLTTIKRNPRPAGTPMNRRSFLGRIADTSTQAVAFASVGSLPFNLAEKNTVEAPEGSPALDHDEYRRKHIPQTHRLALFSLASDQLSANSNADALAWFHEIQSQGICDACGICALHCPTGSLLIENSGQALELKHQASACIGCGLCVSLCPTQALRLDAVDDDVLITEEKISTLFQCHQSICAACGQSFTYSGSDQKTCHSCENEKRIEQDVFGQNVDFRTIKPET